LLPTDVTGALDRLVDSLESLELLVHLHREPRPLSTATLAGVLGLSPQACAKALERLQARGLVASEGELHRIAPATPELQADLDRVVATYGTKRIVMINHVATRSLQRVQALADAFRLRKKDRDD
jgi:biotin operon repressor